MQAPETIVLRGRPGRLSGVVRPALPGGRAQVELTLPRGKATATAAADIAPFGGGDSSTVVVHAPRSLAPGTYRGTLSLDDRRLPLEAHVHRRAHARVSPKHIETHARAGTTLAFEVTVLNDGNVALDIPSGIALDLFDADSFARLDEAAFLVQLGFAQTPRQLESLAGEAYAGRAELKINGGGGLDPGEDRTLKMHIALPKDLPARRLAGSAELAGRQFTLTVQIDTRGGSAHETD